MHPPAITRSPRLPPEYGRCPEQSPSSPHSCCSHRRCAGRSHSATSPKRCRCGSTAPQPVISYHLRVDSADLSVHRRRAARAQRAGHGALAMAAHPEYDDRYWRYLEVPSRIPPRAHPRDARGQCPVARRRAGRRVRRTLPHPAPHAPRVATGGMAGLPLADRWTRGRPHPSAPPRAPLAPAHVVLDLPASWTIATGLAPTLEPRTFLAPTADALLDSPIFAGRVHDWRFAVDDVPHRVVYWPAVGATPFDTTALARGIEAIVRQAVALFGRPPYRDYTFVLQDSAYGALEHRNSVTLGAPSRDLAAMPHWTFSEIAHEFTHAWNLMRIRPAEYGDVATARSARCGASGSAKGSRSTTPTCSSAGPASRCRTQRATRTCVAGRLVSGLARQRALLAERISEVAYNAPPGALGDYVASAHLVGELLGTVLDLRIRDATAGLRSMDDVMPMTCSSATPARAASPAPTSNGRCRTSAAAACGTLFDAPRARRGTDRLRRPAGARRTAGCRLAPGAPSNCRDVPQPRPSRVGLAATGRRTTAHGDPESGERHGARRPAQRRRAGLDRRPVDRHVAGDARRARRRAHRRHAAVRRFAAHGALVRANARGERLRPAGGAGGGDSRRDGAAAGGARGMAAGSLPPPAGYETSRPRSCCRRPIALVRYRRASRSPARSSFTTTFADSVISWSSACWKSATDMVCSVPAERIEPPTSPAPRTSRA